MSVVSWKTYKLPKTVSTPYTPLNSNICEAHPHFLFVASQRTIRHNPDPQSMNFTLRRLERDLGTLTMSDSLIDLSNQSISFIF